ncbi:NCS2 family permease [Tepidimicrobium xylanilyticum]|uniref:Putative MFS transporter, AGZA family, xanthine/uracil permease n=1 Tax=Tepidimicrobium xylanilyticum TaxID=1123352 RepID=A0A1H2RIJ7_9FIRM|nr:NCS2 family permease [Tepidimicrobium xylanilyticum]SDW19251.1 putative MFS transporter, AGZA family, xanthine/uracil permease [Tepidimicrobium xylanilyticum]
MSDKTLGNDGFLERKFKLRENNTDARTEILAGITTFMTMAYILMVNPGMLSETGMDWGGVFTATALSAAIATLMMGLLANYPFALAPGMGLNAFFTYTVVKGMGHTWQFALTAVFLEGIIFILLSFFQVREAIFNAIPINLKKGVSVGIGLFIALIGFVNAGIVQTGDGTILGLGNLVSRGPILALIGLIIMGVLLAKNVKGALLIGIIVTTIIGIPLGITPMPEGFFTLPPSVRNVAFQFEWANIFSMDMLVVMFTFLFVDVFDTVGTLVGVASKANMLDEKGQLPRVSQALLSDAVGTVAGSCLGTSTVTTYVESASGVADGGRTGLTAVSTAVMFLLALFFSPLFAIIPSQATAPALILVGLFMMSPIKEIDLDDFTEAIPAFLTIVMMPFAYSIAEGIVFGMVSYVVLKLITGRYKDISLIMYILAALFILKYIFL